MTGCGPIFIDFEGDSLYLLDFDACSLCRIREILYYNSLQYTFCPSLSFFFWDPHYSNIVSSYGITYLSISPLVVQ